MTLAEIAAVVGGTVHGDPATTVTGTAYLDSRHPVEGGLFVAIAGERVDGHDFAAGAHAVLGSHPVDAPSVVVGDPVDALGRLSRHVVDSVDAGVVALTGSQGKTGTKDYLAHVLAGDGPTVATRGNHNNELGVPITVMETEHDTRHLVVEMGARGVGHIGYLCTLAPPVAAAVLNVGTAHLSEFGSREQIARAKGEIVEALPHDGVAVLNADDALVAPMASRTRAGVLTFGETGDVAWRDVRLDDLGRPSFELGHAGAWRPVTLTQSGRHQVANATAAAALAIARGLELPLVAERLSTARPASRWRMELHTRGDGLVVVNDAYNANPASMTAAIDAAVQIGVHRSGRTVAVLGEMLELGDGADEAHRDVGRHAAQAGVDWLVVVGEGAGPLAEGARSVSAWAGEAVVTDGRDEALRLLREQLAADDVVLVKASRGAALELVADGLLDEDVDR
ncbi:UDP-N-acetylmuramoyl-tripeptide--D-alanyl-D-alanine ligase [Nocardioides aestuarii]|uniref:UDP-N-acetylmuramoyl-tripeptide--D-alanyl-D-alanine ligase n=1 Tax=Nocardioides aestuarii TaxID=252231 RepID=A0ABW4TIN1_9ACTN